jgi:hypothetical protein
MIEITPAEEREILAKRAAAQARGHGAYGPGVKVDAQLFASNDRPGWPVPRLTGRRGCGA